MKRNSGFITLTLTMLFCAGAMAQQPQSPQPPQSQSQSPPVPQAPSALNSLARQLNDAFAGVYKKIAPAVVIIEVRHGEAIRMKGLPPGMEFFFRRPGGTGTDQGSGFIISPDGFIMTNCHVVESALETGAKITIQTKDGQTYPAKLVGADQRSDIAVLKIDARDLPTVELADSDDVKVGQFAFAIGAPYDLPYTFTVGVVSATGRNGLTHSRTYEEYIQTDAAINPGNSGGPLCDIDGRVVGVNTMISGINRGLGFAVPSNIAQRVSQQLITSGRVSRPWLGIGIEGLKNNEDAQRYFPGLKSGVIVMSIEPMSPAYDSDLRAGDVILKVDAKPVAQAPDLQREILSKRVGQNVELDVWRNGKIVPISVRTGEQPDQYIRASSNVWQPRRLPPQPTPGRTNADAGFHGLFLESAPSGTAAHGVRVTDVAPGSAAAIAGLQPNDVITDAAGRPVNSQPDLESALAGADASQGVMLSIERDGQKTFAILKP